MDHGFDPGCGRGGGAQQPLALQSNTAALTSRSTFSAVNPAQINAVFLIILFLMEFTEVLI